MPLSKDDASDLKSHMNRVIQTAHDLDRAQLAWDQAKRNLDSFIWEHEHGSKKPEKG